jgi:flagellar biosynthesis/type III secretory pathway protein FliH
MTQKNLRDWFLEMTSDQIFKSILDGAVALEDFQDWIENDITRNRADAYETGKQIGYESGYHDGQRDGYDSGYEACQENYGDGPSS